jgi:hypothetical protein
MLTAIRRAGARPPALPGKPHWKNKQNKSKFLLPGRSEKTAYEIPTGTPQTENKNVFERPLLRCSSTPLKPRQMHISDQTGSVINVIRTKKIFG